MSQETQTGALYQPRGVSWRGRWEGHSRRRGDIHTHTHTHTHIYLWLIHVEV